MRAVIYARYSSDKQREASIEDQVEVCRRYAAAQGWTVVGTYRDAAVPRTLRRHLAVEGTTFEAVRDDVGFVLARELLVLTDLPIGEVSATLGFANQTAFVRAFRRWSGSTPSQWRTGIRQV